MIQAKVAHKQTPSTSPCARSRRVLIQGRFSMEASVTTKRHHNVRVKTVRSFLMQVVTLLCDELANAWREDTCATRSGGDRRCTKVHVRWGLSFSWDAVFCMVFGHLCAPSHCSSTGRAGQVLRLLLLLPVCVDNFCQREKAAMSPPENKRFRARSEQSALYLCRSIGDRTYVATAG